ncbi:MAG: response regulator transcription factor [Bacteroidota bacterium]|jgi:DNA-binding response OmpR family regulator|nr:response regulator transcription factor [Bacteroidota bacterium]
MRLLIIEDEPGIANFIRDGLSEEGYVVDIAGEGRSGLAMALAGDYDLILLDWMLPGISGIELLRGYRTAGRGTPVIFLTARDTVDDAVFGLDAGANDYIRKPFQFDELLARIRVQLRETPDEEAQLRLGDITLQLDTHSVRRGDEEIALTPKEFTLLAFLLRNKGRVCTRTRIIEHVWDMHFDSDTSVIDVYINYLRKKLDRGEGPSLIHTVRGVGYMIRSEEE